MVARRRRRSVFSGAVAGRAPDHYDSLDDDLLGEPEEIEESVIAQEPAPLGAATEQVRQIMAAARQRQEEAARAREAAQNALQNAGTNAVSSESAEAESGELLSPSDRLTQVRTRAPEFEREYRLRLVNRLLMRNVPLDEIANQLNVSISTVQRDRREIFQRMKQEASRLDINALLGQTLAYYNELGAMSLRVANAEKTPVPHKLAALRTAMQSRKEMGQWLSAAGVFEILKYAPQENAASGDLAKLIALTEKVFEYEDKDLGDIGNIDDGDIAGSFDDDNIELML